MIQFFMPMIPPTVTAQEHQVAVRNGKPHFYNPPELAKAKEKLCANLAMHKPERKLEGALRLVVKWCFPVTANHKAGEYKITRPDTDNLNKLLKDCMTQVGFWNDDAQVASEICEKFFSDITGIWIRIDEL